jgi:uncharacterized protein (TIGR02246 family)
MRSRNRWTGTTLLTIGLSLAVSLTACSSGQDNAQQQALQHTADIYAIQQIEVNWHKASSTHDVDLMMSLWADNATFTVGGKTYTGKDQIRSFFTNDAAPFKAEYHWVSDSPAYKEKVTADGDHGTLYFECDYIDVPTRKVVAVVSADQDVQRINGRWLITNSVAATPQLTS